MSARRAVVAALAAVAFTGGGAAAFYRSTVVSGGTATGAVTTGTPVPLTTTATTPAGTTLTPGGTGDLVVRVTNPNVQTAIRVTSIAADGAVTGCTTPAVTVVAPSAGLPFTLAPSETRTITLTAAVQMGPAASSDCQGQTLTVPVLLNG